MSEHLKPVKVTISDPETGAVLEERVLTNDYALICAGNRFVKHIQRWGTTHVLAVALAKPQPSGERTDSATAAISPEPKSSEAP